MSFTRAEQRSRTIPHSCAPRAAIALLLVAGALVPSSRAADSNWRFTRSIELPALEQEQLVGVTLDGAVFSNVRQDSADLRVLSADDAVVPYLVRAPQETRTRTFQKSWTARVDGQPLPSGGLELLLSLRDHEPEPEGVILATPLKDFEFRVQVFTSADGAEWTENGEHLIFDYSTQLNVRQLSVPIRYDGQRRFRLLISRVTKEQESELLELTRRLKGGEEIETIERVTVARRSFRVNGAAFYRTETEQQTTGPRLTTYPVQRFAVEEDRPLKRTLLFVDMLHEPVNAFKIETPSKSFSRKVEAQFDGGTPDAPDWMMMGEATITRIDLPTLKRDETTVSFPAKRAGKYRLLIENLDSPPIEVTGVEAEGAVAEVTFMAQSGQKYRLAYGDPNAKALEFDTLAIRSRLETGEVPLAATLGEPVERTGGPPVAPLSLADLINNPLIAVPVLLLLVAALGWGLYRATREVDTIPPQQQG